MATTTTRRLAAILAADVVGYSRLMGADEEGTHERVKAHLVELFDPRPNRPRVIQSCDCFVDAQGVMFLTDNNAGLYILQFEGA